MNPEQSFATEFQLAIQKRKWIWLTIPDAIMTQELLSTASYRGRVSALKRPCDGILVTENGVLCIELKANSNPAKDHQAMNCTNVNMLCPGKYLFVRKTAKYYTVEYIPFLGKKMVMKKSTELSDILDYLETMPTAHDKLKQLEEM